MHVKKRKSLHPPEEIVGEILLKLPVKSLIRYKCVCKTWSERLRNPNFIRAHYRNQEIVDVAESMASKSLLKRFDGKEDFYFTTLECGVNEVDEANMKTKEYIFFLVLVVKRSSLSFHVDSTPRVLGSCNGIICLNDYETVALWNPASREFKRLPASNVIHPRGTNAIFSVASAFGYDRKINDYKVLRLVYFQTRGNEEPLQVELYSSTKNECKEILFPLNPGRAAHKLNISMDGVYHSDYQRCGIMSFDIVDEVFAFTTYPSNWDSSRRIRMDLTSVNKCLAAVRSDVSYGTASRIIDVWVLKKVGVMESWTREMTIGWPIVSPREILGFWNTRMFVETREKELAVYNLKSQGIKTLELKSPGLYQMQLVNYVESLAPISGKPEHEMGVIRIRSLS